jgi:hypothetical protein
MCSITRIVLSGGTPGQGRSSHLFFGGVYRGGGNPFPERWFIGTQFSNPYTAVDSPPKLRHVSSTILRLRDVSSTILPQELQVLAINLDKVILAHVGRAHLPEHKLFPRKN